MCRVNRVKYAATLVGVAFFGLAPMTASAGPSPSPSLDSILAKPPSTGFVELTTATLHGEFTAHDWATNATGATATETETTLNRYGFVDGYGKTWTSTPTQQALIEVVMAFTGGQGARKTLTALERSDKGDANYQHSDTISGIDTYYGLHLFDSANGLYEDAFGFVKGNDVFEVFFVSSKDDALTPAVTQTQAQYSAAPDSTIPSSSWPENASSSSSSFPAGAFGIAVAFVVVVVAALAFFVMRRRGSAPVPVGAYGMPAAPGAVGAPGGVGTPGAGGAVQMSPDGNFWWDGQAWKDAALEAPPAAQRSSDGTLWWDGQKWRPVGQAPPEQPPTWPSS